MLLCVCLNPALDVTYRLERTVALGESHRVAEVSVRAGGKGVNVARVLGQLGQKAVVLGFAGGVDGERLRDELGRDDVAAQMVAINASTRRTLTVVDDERVTAFNEPGPRVTTGEWTSFQDRFQDLLDGADGVVLSGSLPPGLPPEAYATLTRIAGDKPVLLDADGEALRRGLEGRPALVKPNLAEVRGLMGDEDIVEAGRRLRDLGARASVVSLGAEGLYASSAEGSWRAFPAAPQTGNPTGAGDALAAVLAHGLVTGRPWPDLLRDAVATSASAVARPVAGEIDLDLRAALAATVAVEAL